MTNRAERRHRTETKARARLRQWRDYYRMLSTDWDDPMFGKGRSKSHFDCGRARCVTCHWAKLTNQPRRQEMRLDP